MRKQFKRQHTTGAERKGIRGDMRLVLAEDRPSVEREPTAQKAASLISSVRYYGDREGNTPAEAMTATSAALYEYLMARWRPSLKDKEACAVSYADAKAYLGIEKTSRLRSYMSALSSTWVSYDFLDMEEGFRRKGNRVQLLNCEELTHEVSGEQFVGVSMFPAVRKAILESDRWANLELGAYPRFSSKYTAILYPTLALMSGRDHRPPMIWAPVELAELLGWQPDVFKFSNFESRVLKPVLDDIRNHVRRFSIDCEYVRATSRGRPVSQIVINVGKATKTADEYPKAPMTRSDRSHVSRIASAAALDVARELPGEDALRRAATRLRIAVTAVVSDWTEAFADEALVAQIEREGLIPAFNAWVLRQEQKSDCAEAEDAADEDIRFDAVEMILVTVAEGYDIADAATALGRHRWTGEKPMTLRLVKNADQIDMEVYPTEVDVGRLFRDHTDIIDEIDLEYAA
jgi:hypothetical protein